MKERFHSYLKPFTIMTIFYIISVFVLRFIDFTIIGNADNFSGLIYGNIIAAAFTGLCIFVIYSSIYIISKKAALVASAILFSLCFVIEAGLMIYHKSTGLLMGNEIILRPLWETWFTIKSTLNFFIVAGTILLILVYILVSLFLSKNNINTITSYITFLLMAVSVPLFFILNPSQGKFIVNKTWYCIYACIYGDEENENSTYTLSKIDFDNEKVETYKQIFPEKKILDNKYPLEVKDNINNVLGSFFKESDTKPNIVFIVVESLGADLFGVNDYGYTFTPFLDSLSKHSLLWTYCLSTTPRSFGAVPATTGSVPHGTQGFQFGDIPNHNSLFSILKDNGYKTSAFYAGDFSFDKVYDYLISQKVDFLAPFVEDQKRKENKHHDYTYWGYHDKPMFEKSLEIIEQRNPNEPNLDLFMTVSQHDNRLNLNDKKRSDVYYEKAEEIISKLPEDIQKKYNDILGHLAATIYGDDAIKYFIERYQKHDDKNTIFVITGDHSLNINPSNKLNAFHVPLIIWSPLLEKSMTFNSVVSHNDIVPTLNALLRDNFKLKTPEYIHWVGNELDTATTFRCNLNSCFLRYTRNIYDGVFDGYYYTTEKGIKKAYKIKEKIQLEEINNSEIIADIDKKFSTMKYVDNYAYTNNKVTKNPLFPQDDLMSIRKYVIDSVYCATNAEKPSDKKPKGIEILSTKIDRHYDVIKVVMTADVVYTSNVWQDQFINLGIKLTHDKNETINSIDNISKSFSKREYKPNKPIKLEFTKVYSVKKFGVMDKN